MSEPVAGVPKVVRLAVIYDGSGICELKADIVYPIEYLDLNTDMRKTIDFWDQMTAGQKKQFEKLLESILSE